MTLELYFYNRGGLANKWVQTGGVSFSFSIDESDFSNANKQLAGKETRLKSWKTEIFPLLSLDSVFSFKQHKPCRAHCKPWNWGQNQGQSINVPLEISDYRNTCNTKSKLKSAWSQWNQTMNSSTLSIIPKGILLVPSIFGIIPR